MNLCVSADGAKRGLRDMLVCVAVLFGLAGVAHCGAGCMPVNSPEYDYETEIIACAQTSGYPGAYDREADMRCRAAVDCRYGVGPC